MSTNRPTINTTNLNKNLNYSNFETAKSNNYEKQRLEEYLLEEERKKRQNPQSLSNVRNIQRGVTRVNRNPIPKINIDVHPPAKSKSWFSWNKKPTTRKVLHPMNYRGFPSGGPDPTIRVMGEGNSKMIWNFGSAGGYMKKLKTKRHKKHNTTKRRGNRK